MSTRLQTHFSTLIALFILLFAHQGYAQKNLEHFYYQGNQINVIDASSKQGTSFFLAGDHRIAGIPYNHALHNSPQAFLLLDDGKNQVIRITLKQHSATNKTYSTDSQDYQPYGTNNTTHTHYAFGYNKEYQDTATHFLYLRARTYDPLSQRFMTRDSRIGLFNDYSFAGGNPIMHIDPSGHMFKAVDMNEDSLLGLLAGILDPEILESKEDDPIAYITQHKDRFVAVADRGLKHRTPPVPNLYEDRRGAKGLQQSYHVVFHAMKQRLQPAYLKINLDMLTSRYFMPQDIKSMVYSFASNEPLTFVSVHEMRTMLGLMEYWNDMMLPIIEDPTLISKFERNISIPHMSGVLGYRLRPDSDLTYWLRPDSDSDSNWQNEKLFMLEGASIIPTSIQERLGYDPT